MKSVKIFFSTIFVIMFPLNRFVVIVNGDRIDSLSIDPESGLILDYFNERDVRVAAIFACSFDESRKILKILVENPNRTVISKYSYFDMGQYFFKMIHAPYNKLGIYLNYSCEFGKYIFSKGSSVRLFNERFVWLLINHNKSVIDELKPYNLQLDSDMLVGVVDKFYGPTNVSTNLNRKHEIKLYDIYKIQDHLEMRALYAGFWSSEARLNIVLKGTKTSRRSDLMGISVDGTAVLSQMSFNKTMDEEEMHKKIMDVSHKSHLDIINRFPFIMNMNLAEMYNFTQATSQKCVYVAAPTKVVL